MTTPRQPRPWSSLSEEELDEVNYLLRATGNAPVVPDVEDDLDDDDLEADTDLPMSVVTATTTTTTAPFRPASSIGSTVATVVHIHQPNRPTKNVIFYPDKQPLTSYHNVIKVTPTVLLLNLWTQGTLLRHINSLRRYPRNHGQDHLGH